MRLVAKPQPLMRRLPAPEPYDASMVEKRDTLTSGSRPSETVPPGASPLPAARAVRAGDLVFSGGCVALDEEGQVMAPGDVRAQANAIFQSIAQILAEASGTLADVLAMTSFHADPRSMEDVFAVGYEYFDDEFPAWTPVGFVGCQHADALLQIRVVASVGEGSKECFVPDSLRWLTKYPVSGACKKNNLVFIAGQSGADADGLHELPLDHCRQARRAYDRVTELVELGGGTLDDVIDFTSFHLDIRGAVETLEKVYIPDVMGPIHADESATTSHLGATGLLTPDTWGVYSAIADLTPGRRVGSTPDSIWWKGEYPVAGAAMKEHGRLVTVAGQVASAPKDRNAVLHSGDIAAQARFVFESIRDALAGFGLTLADVVEVISFHKDPRHWDAVMSVASEFFDPSNPPAWTFSGVTGLWVEGYQHEIAALAVAD
jgi:2-iminobutanoate/2-iminopropanoate deaminase